MRADVPKAYTAFSRMPSQPKTYMQDVLKQQVDKVWQLLQDIYGSQTGANGEVIEEAGERPTIWPMSGRMEGGL